MPMKDGVWCPTDEELERDCTCRCLGCLLHWHAECEDPPCVWPPESEWILDSSELPSVNDEDGDGNI